MTEFVRLRTKMYALRVDASKKDIKKASRVVIARFITFNDYRGVSMILDERAAATVVWAAIKAKTKISMDMKTTKKRVLLVIEGRSILSILP